MNHIALMGRLTKDPKLKYSQSGKAVSKFTLAVTREFNREEADFINCIAWGKTAETIAEYLRRGRRIAVRGRISTRSYEQNGETRWITEVVVDKFEFIDSAASSVTKEAVSQESAMKSFEGIEDDEEMSDEDFPF